MGSIKLHFLRQLTIHMNLVNLMNPALQPKSRSSKDYLKVTSNATGLANF
jgi:hypothetical protein